jgi:hypothetical protein
VHREKRREENVEWVGQVLSLLYTLIFWFVQLHFLANNCTKVSKQRNMGMDRQEEERGEIEKDGRVHSLLYFGAYGSCKMTSFFIIKY